MPYIEFWLLVVSGLVAVAVVCYTVGDVRGRRKERKYLHLEMSYLLHDVKSPLSSILTYTDMLKAAPPGSPPFNQAVDNIAWQSEMLTDQFQYLSGLALLRASRRLTGETTDSSKTLEEVCSRTPQKDDRPLSWTLEPNVWVKANHTMVIRVVNNLIGNSIKYGGATTVTLTRKKRFCQIVISNQGDSIPWWNLKRIFIAGVQLHKDRGGQGLGLSSVKAMIRAIGGRVSVRNLPEGGVAFTVLLPLSKSIPKAQQSGSNLSA